MSGFLSGPTCPTAADQPFRDPCDASDDEYDAQIHQDVEDQIRSRPICQPGEPEACDGSIAVSLPDAASLIDRVNKEVIQKVPDSRPSKAGDEVEEINEATEKAEEIDAGNNNADAENGEDQNMEKSEAAAAPAVAPEPAAPAAPGFKLSQIVPMMAMMGLQKFNLEEMGYTHHVEVGYIVVQLLCFGFLYLTSLRIHEMVDDGCKIKISEVQQMGQVVTPAKEQTAKEYDMEQLKEAVKQPFMGFVILGGIYYKWGSLMPLVMQILMTPMSLYEAPLTQIHFMGKKINRPFVKPSMFGLPSTPTSETAVDATAEKKDQ